MASLLTDDEIQSALARLPGWQREAGALVKNYSFPAYRTPKSP
jgi:Pterin-4a-carbinolamine dehydratase